MSRRLSSVAIEVDLRHLSNPPLPTELWLAIFDGFTYAQLHRTRAINQAFERWVLSGQYDDILWRGPPASVAALREASKRHKLAFHPVFRHLVLDESPDWREWHARTGRTAGRKARRVKIADLGALQENATYPPVRSLSLLGMDLPESRTFTNITGKDPSQPVTVLRVLQTLSKILAERVYLPGNIDRETVPWVRAYERSSGRISWRGEYTSPWWIMVEAFEPWEGRFSATVDRSTGEVSLLVTGFHLHRDPDDEYWRR